MSTPRANTAEYFVIDASVALKLFVEEPLSSAADALFSRLASNPDCRFFVPDLFYIECANILWKYVNRWHMPEDKARLGLSTLQALALTRIESIRIVDEALKLALHHGITVYDACYAATGRLVGAPLVTADRKLIQKLDEPLNRVMHLERFAPPA